MPVNSFGYDPETFRETWLSRLRPIPEEDLGNAGVSKTFAGELSSTNNVAPLSPEESASAAQPQVPESAPSPGPTTEGQKWQNAPDL